MIDALRLFETPLYVLDLPDMTDLNAQVLAWLPGRRAADEGIQRSNSGGWHSTPDLTVADDPVCKALMNRLVMVSRETLRGHYQRAGVTVNTLSLSVQAWAMVLEHNDYVTPHDHAGAHWSAVYYVDAGDDPAEGLAGNIAFSHPVTGLPQIPGLPTDPTEFSLQPKAGILVMFPAWLRHYVHPYRGTRPRVAVSLNITLRAT